jgi:hypothetical protein
MLTDYLGYFCSGALGYYYGPRVRIPPYPLSLVSPAILAISICLALCCSSSAQQDDYVKAVPILSGSTGLITSIDGGHAQLIPVFDPVLLLPLGDRWLVESRAEFTGDFQSNNGRFSGPVEKEIDYLQLDYIANRYATVTLGRFLTPFGIYNERLYPVWIRNLQTTPLLFPIGTGSSDGVMVRGGFEAHPGVDFNYAVYFSTLSTVNKLDSDRLAGGRLGLFLPDPRVEFGISVQHLLQEDHSNAVGFHFEWQPRSTPVDLRAEYAHSPLGSGYWAESAYRLSDLPVWNGVLRGAQIVVRMQQFFVGDTPDDAAAEYGVPDSDAKQAELGLNYFLKDGLKVTSSYGRQFTTQGNANIWTVGIAYRFAVPLGRAQ